MSSPIAFLLKGVTQTLGQKSAEGLNRRYEHEARDTALRFKALEMAGKNLNTSDKTAVAAYGRLVDEFIASMSEKGGAKKRKGHQQDIMGRLHGLEEKGIDTPTTTPASGKTGYQVPGGGPVEERLPTTPNRVSPTLQEPTRTVPQQADEGLSLEQVGRTRNVTDIKGKMHHDFITSPEDEARRQMNLDREQELWKLNNIKIPEMVKGEELKEQLQEKKDQAARIKLQDTFHLRKELWESEEGQRLQRKYKEFKFNTGASDDEATAYFKIQAENAVRKADDAHKTAMGRLADMKDRADRAERNLKIRLQELEVKQGQLGVARGRLTEQQKRQRLDPAQQNEAKELLTTIRQDQATINKLQLDMARIKNNHAEKNPIMRLFSSDDTAPLQTQIDALEIDIEKHEQRLKQLGVATATSTTANTSTTTTPATSIKGKGVGPLNLPPP